MTRRGASSDPEISGYRSYEIYQRERAREAQPIMPGELRSPAYHADPFPILAKVREHTPCYRDWKGNAFWVTRYDDVTSVFVDDANYQTRPRRFAYGDLPGRDLSGELAVMAAEERGADTLTEGIFGAIIDDLAAGGGDLALAGAWRLAAELRAAVLGIPADMSAALVGHLGALQLGTGTDPVSTERGRRSFAALVELLGPLLEKRRAEPADDLLSAVAQLELEGGPAGAEDLVVTLLEEDHHTLGGALANLWALLLSHPDQWDDVVADPFLVRQAYLEALRHSPPVVTAARHTRREVERFGRLLPKGALVQCSAAAANRDPRIFAEPDRFDIHRKDLCQREPRGQYRADGLASGITFGLGPPSRFPAVPEDRPRSRYAITRDTAVRATTMLVDALPKLRLAPGATPDVRIPYLGGPYACWHLPVTV